MTYLGVLTVKERRAEILNLLDHGGYVQGYIFARFFAVSERTIRRDMVALRKAGHNIRLGTADGYILRKPRSPLERDKL